MENNKKRVVGYQGISGAYSEMAAEKFFSSVNTQFKGYESFDEIFEDVSNGSLDYGVVPIENSLAGSIHKNFDLLKKYDLKIVGEVYVHVNHQLLVIPGTKYEDIEQVYSHWQALAQCSGNINKFLPNGQAVEYFDTAGSAEYVSKENDKTKVAIASKKAGEVYGLESLNQNFEDDKNNYTRFVVIEPGYKKLEEEEGSVKFKTSIFFDGKSVAGFLYNALGCFARRNLNLSKIESRPVPNSPWAYCFYLDFEGRYDDQEIKEAIEELSTMAHEVKVLGSYVSGTLD